MHSPMEQFEIKRLLDFKIGGLIVGFAAGVNNAWRAIRVFSEDAAKGGDRLP